VRNFSVIIILFISTLTFSAGASDISKRSFDTYGSVQTIKYKPVNSPLSFLYDVQYYIPAKLKGKTNLNTLVFLHGGGASTMTRAGSLRVTQMYMDDLKSIADNLGIVLVLPSGSGNNWGGHMLSFLRSLNETLRSDLPINPNKIALSGHSMGGMGITRSAHWLADEFAFFMPTAAGMKESRQTDRNLRPYMNMKYHHLQGLQDHFQVFVTRCENQQKAIDDLERRYNKKTGFELEFYNGSHNYPKEIFQSRLGTMFKNVSRDLYQTELYGTLYKREEVIAKEGTQKWFNAYSRRYFWLKGLKFTNDQDLVLVDAKIQNNIVTIKAESTLKKIRVYLSDKMVNLKNKVTIIINGKSYFQDIPATNLATSVDQIKDSGFKFQSYVDLTI